MNIKPLEYFMAVAKAGSITKAADDLYISQPALSRCIGSLEKELGFALFTRSAQGITLTEAGDAMLIGLTEAADVYEKTINRARAIAADNYDDLSLSCSFEEFNSEILFSLQEKHLDVRTHYSILPPDQAYRELLAGKTDFAILPTMPKHNDIHAELLMTEEMLVSTNPNHPLCGRKTVSAGELDGQTVSCNEVAFDNSTISQICARSGIKLDIRFVSNDHQQVGMYRRRYNCLTFVPISGLMPREDEEVGVGQVQPETRTDLVFPTRVEPQIFCREINIAWQKGRLLSRADKYLLELLRSYYSSLSERIANFTQRTYN